MCRLARGDLQVKQAIVLDGRDGDAVALAFLGGSFYSISMLPPVWQTITLFNPVVYLISAFRWSFYGVADVNVGLSVGMTLGFLALCLVIVSWMFRSGYRLKN